MMTFFRTVNHRLAFYGGKPISCIIRKVVVQGTKQGCKISFSTTTGKTPVSFIFSITKMRSEFLYQVILHLHRKWCMTPGSQLWIVGSGYCVCQDTRKAWSGII